MLRDGLIELNLAAKAMRIDLVSLAAATAIWANPAVHQWLSERHSSGAFFPLTRRYKRGFGEARNTFTVTERLDDNTYANHAAKRSMGARRGDLINFAVCHVWPESCYDSACHTVIANLVLLPTPIAALSDHHPEVIAALQFRSYELYGWHPATVAMPVRPELYPSNWREPEAFDLVIQKALSKRKLDYLSRFNANAT